MKRILRVIALAFLAGFALADWALAADMPKPYLKATPPPAPTGGWSCYLGGNGGVARTGANVDLLEIPGIGNLNPSGLMAGGTLGCGGFVGASVYVGVDADIDYDFSKTNVPFTILQSETSMVGISGSLKNGFFSDQMVILGLPLGAQQSALGNLPPLPVSIPSPGNWPIPVQLPTSAMLAQIMPYVGVGVAERAYRGCISAVATSITTTIGASTCGNDFIAGLDVGGGFRVPISTNAALDVKYQHAFWNKTFTPANSVTIFGPNFFKSTSEDLVTGRLIFFLN